MNNKISTLSTVAALLLGSSVVNAEGLALPGTIQIPSGNLGYVNADGEAIRTGLGDCLKVSEFSEDNQVNACEGIEDTETATTEPEAAPEPEPAPAPEVVTKEPIVTTATIGGEALFDSGSSSLGASSEQAMSALVAQLSKYQEISAIQVTGHTDSTGSESLNQSLSEQRAASVEEFLKAAYPNARVSSRGLGESSPVATNSTRDGRAQNRRVEVQVTAKSITE